MRYRLFFASVIAIAAALVDLRSAGADVLIGVVGPLTGQAMFRGEQVQNGAQKATSDLNREGGVLGQRVKLVSADDACDPDQAVAVAKKLVADGVKFVVGHVCSHSSIPAAKVYSQAKVLMISPASTNPDLTDKGSFGIFRVCGRDDVQGKIAGQLLAHRWPNSKIAIIHDNTTYGHGLASQTKTALNNAGVTETIFEKYSPGKSDYSELVTRLQDGKIDVVYIGGYPAEAGLIAREAYGRGARFQFIGGDAITTEEYWLVAGKAGKGTLVTFGPDPRRLLEAANVVREFRQQGFEPAGYTLHAYAAVQVWAQAIKIAASFDAVAVTKAIKSGRFKTVLGTVDFDEKGDVTAPGFIWYVWDNGDYKPVK